MRAFTHIRAGGNGVPNAGPWQHRQPGTVVGYRYRYHDEQVTGSAYVESPEIPPADYATLRSAAKQGASAFAAAVTSSGWSTFFGIYTGIDMTEARLGVLDLG